MYVKDAKTVLMTHYKFVTYYVIWMSLEKYGIQIFYINIYPFRKSTDDVISFEVVGKNFFFGKKEICKNNAYHPL